MIGASITVDGIHYRYPDGTVALTDVSTQAAAGERVAVLGPNGAGKSTLARHLNGIHEPQAGSVYIDGIRVEPDSYREIRRRVQLVFQDPDDQLFMSTLAEDVAFGPANLGLDQDQVRKRVDMALDAVGVGELGNRPPHHLSGGEKRRGALATVLAMEPDILVLDEPMAGLDPVGRRRLLETLDELPQTMVLITHDLPFALQLCERAVVMHRGQVTAEGPIASVLADEDLLAANGLELPFGFDRSMLAGHHP